jgi:Zn-dependent protease with chaperone function
MQNRRLFAFIFGVPLGGVLVSGILAAHLETQLPKALLKAAAGSGRKVDSALRQQVYASTVADVCAGGPGEKDLEDVCGTYRHIRWIRKASTAAILLGLFMVVTPWAAGFTARSNRRVLLYFFKPGIYGTLVLTAVLIVLNAAILIASAYYLMAIFPDPAFQWTLLFPALGGVYGAWIMVRSLASLPRRASVTVLGLPVSPDEQPGLWAHVRWLAEKTGAAVPDHIVIGLEPGFFVTEVDAHCIGGELKGRTMFVSLPMSRMLTLPEFSAVICHELGHFKGLDTRFSRSFYPVYRGTGEALTRLADFAEEGQSTLVSFAVLPGLAALDHFYASFAEAENAISRERELAADAMAAETSGRVATASALVKLHAYEPLWDSFVARSRRFLKEGRNYAVRQSVTFVDGVAAADLSKLLKDLPKTRTAHPTDSHPPLGARLDALGVDLAEVAETARAIKPADAAALLLDEIDKLDEALSHAQTAQMAQDLGIELQPEAQA